MRVRDIVTELGASSSKEVLDRLHKLGIEAKSHMSTLDPEAVELIKKAYTQDAKAKAETKTIQETVKAEPKTEKKPAPATHKEKTAEAKPTHHPKATEKKKPETTVEKPKHVAEKSHPTPAPEHKITPPVPPPAVKPATIAPVVQTTIAVKETSKIIKIKTPIIVKEFAELLGMRPNKLIAELMSLNVLASINEKLDAGAAKKIAEKHGFQLEHEKKTSDYSYAQKTSAPSDLEIERPEDYVSRPPVVVFMGHVDHGKTSLMDRIRNTTVAKGEHGGITQHIGAYTVNVNGKSITFLDTPGHEAFTAMRARGANMTDIAVIIIAGDDGIMPQTKEAIMHAKAAKVAVMVAINKCDLPAANPTRVKQQLQGVDLAPEEWGGTTICAEVSAVTAKGIPQLLEMIILQAEMLELKANPKLRAKGYVIEAQMKAGMGPTATILVTNGTLKVGDTLLCGQYWGRVRALVNDHGIKVKSATPSTPIICLGLSGVPEAGAEFKVCQNDKIARDLAEQEAHKTKERQLIIPKRASLEDLYQHITDNAKKLELKLILKTDTQGSVEALTHSLSQIKSDKVSLNILFGGTGNVTPNDVMLAKASDGIIMGFHVSKEPGVDSIARHEGIEIRIHHIIYEMIDEVRNAMTGLLKPIVKEKIIGHAKVLQVFAVGKTAKIAGCMITDGSVKAKSKVRVKRAGEVLHEGALDSLKHFQNHASEVKESQECGIRLANYRDFLENDIFEFYELEEIKQDL